MRISGTEYRTVCLLGAGASRGAIRHRLFRRKRIRAPLNGDFFKVASTYAQAAGANSEAQRKLDRLRQVFKRDLPSKGTPPMEDAFSMLYVAKDFPDIYNRGRGRRAVAGERKEIGDFLYLLFQVLTVLDEDAHQHTGYDDLASLLSNGDTLLTLNYDTMLDSALHRAGWDPASGYGISGTSKKVKWAKLADLERSLDVKLLKLHGSLNWFVKGSQTDLKKVFSSKPVRITKPRRNEISKHIRQIVPPLYGKIFEHAHWQTLWTEAFRALCEAEVIVVVGCSLVATDFHLRALFSQVARTRKQNGERFKRLYLVDKTKIRNKWKALLKASYVRQIGHPSFQSFLASCKRE